MSIKSRWEEYKEKNGVTPLDMFRSNTLMVSEDRSNNRLSICKRCPEFIKLTTQCKKCGCFMSAKTKLEPAKCPIGNW